MSNTNGNITAPVSINDVKTVLGFQNNNLSSLCKSSYVNMWSKYKPVNFTSTGPLSEENWKTANYGIKNIPYWTDFESMVDWIAEKSPSLHPPGNLNYNDSMYFFNQPYGGVQSPYRLSDFKNYVHNSNMPIGKCMRDNVQLDSNNHFTLQFLQSDYYSGLKLEGLTVGTNIQFKDLYLGVLFYRELLIPTVSESVIEYFATIGGVQLSNSSLYQKQYNSDGSFSILHDAIVDLSDASALGPPDGELRSYWNILPFASSVNLTNIGNLNSLTPTTCSGIFIPFLPAKSNLSVTAAPLNIDLQFVGASIDDEYVISYDFKIMNNSNQTLTTSSIVVYLYNSDMVNILSSDWNNLTMAPGSVHEYSSNMTVEKMNDANVLKLVIEVNGQEFDTQTNITYNY